MSLGLHLTGRNKLAVAGLIFICLLTIFGLSPKALAQNPTTISFQGKVVNSNGTNVADGTYPFVFKLYTVSSGGIAIWTETQSSVSVAAGVFQVNLGSVCPFFVANACNSNTVIDFNASSALYLGITFNSDPAGEMTPRVQLQSVPYAYNADKVGGLSASQLVQLSPGSAQSGFVNVTGNGTFGGTVQAPTITATTGVITPSLTSTGALVINSGAAKNVTIDSAASGTAAINIGGTNATSIALSRAGQTTTVNGALVVNQNATFNQNVIMTFSGTENLAITSDLAGNVNGISFIGTPSTTAGNTNGIYVAQAASANTNGLDNAITVDNANTTLPIGSAINILNTGGGGYTNLISSPSFTLDGNGQMIGKGFNYFDPSLMNGATTLVGSGGSTGGNFGGVFDSGAFISNTDMYSQEFVASYPVATTNNRNVGDSGNWYFNNNGQTQTSSSDISTDGGYFRITNGTTSGRGGLVAEGATPGTLDKPLNAANLPILQMKVRPSVVRATDDMVWGMADTATAPTVNNTLPANGIFFWTNNSTGTGGWQGVVRSGGATKGTVDCPGGITTNFATGRIVVVDATTVRFFIDVDATDGVNLVDCGKVTATLPTADLAMEMYDIHTTNTASTFDIDYARFWQDDSRPTAPTQMANAVASEQTAADISTGGDDQTPLTSPGVAATDSTQTGTNAPSSTSPSETSDTLALAADPSQSSNLLSVQSIQDATSSSDTSTSPPQSVESSFRLVDDQGKTVASVDSAGNTTFNGTLNLANASVSGGLSVGGDLNIAGLSIFQKLATFLGKTIFNQDVQINGHLTLGTDSAGYASLRAGESIVHVTFKTAYSSPPIVTAVVTNGQFTLSSVSNVTTSGFDIILPAPASQPTIFSWTAVSVLTPQTSSNPLPSISPTTTPPSSP